MVSVLVYSLLASWDNSAVMPHSCLSWHNHGHFYCYAFTCAAHILPRISLIIHLANLNLTDSGECLTGWSSSSSMKSFLLHYISVSPVIATGIVTHNLALFFIFPSISIIHCTSLRWVLATLFHSVIRKHPKCFLSMSITLWTYHSLLVCLAIAVLLVRSDTDSVSPIGLHVMHLNSRYLGERINFPLHSR